MKRGSKRFLKILALFSAVLFATKGLAVRSVIWEGGAPISLGTVVKVNERLMGRPIWLISESQIRHWLKGEPVGKLKVRRKLPWTVIVIAEPYELAGVIAKGSKGIVFDRNGIKRAEVPLFATNLPFLFLPKGVPVQKCMLLVHKVLEASSQQGIEVRAIWVNQFGEVAIYLPEGFWLRLGNSKALELKLLLSKAIYQNNLLPPNSVADLSALKVISLWQNEQNPKRGRVKENEAANQ